MAQTTIAQQDFSVGMDREAAPNAIDARALYDLLNGLYGKSAETYRRGGTENKSGAAFGSLGVTWLFDGYFDAGQRTVFANASDFGVLDADDSTVVNLGSDGLSVPKPSAMLEGMLFIGGGFIYGGARKASYSTGTITTTNGSKTVTGAGTAWDTDADAGMLLQCADERVYLVATVDSATQVTLRDAYEGTSAGAKGYALNNLYKMRAADPYEIGEFYAVIANRLLMATTNKFRYSEIERPHVWEHQQPGDPAPSPNEHELPDGLAITGFGVPGPQLLVFTTAGLWTVQGLQFASVDPNGNPQHTIQPLAREMVLWSGPGIASWAQALIVPTLAGIHVLDGISTPTRISRQIDKLYREYVEAGYRAGQAVVYRGHYFLPILTAAGTTVRDMLVCRLDRPVRSQGETVFPWSRFDGTGGSLVAFAVRAPITAVEPILLGAELLPSARVVNCSFYFEPDADHKNDADDSTFDWMMITRDYETGNLTENVVRKLKARYELVEDGTDNPRLQFDYGFGRRDSGGKLWDINVWGDDDGVTDEEDLEWGDADDDIYFQLHCPGPESTGLDTHHCRINKKVRFIRFRIRCNDPCAQLRFRSLELFIRPSQAVRK